MRVKKSLRESKKSIKNLGYLLYCPICLNRGFIGLGECVENCECGYRFRVYGPIWLGSIRDEEVVEKMLKYADENVKKFVRSLSEELDIPLAYNIHSLSKKLKINPPKMENVIESLRERGFKASRAHYSGVVVKTDAKLKDLISLLNSQD